MTLEEYIEKLNTEVAELEQRHAELEQRQLADSEQISYLIAHIRQLQEELSTIEQSLAANSAEQASVETQIEDLSTELQEALSKQEALNQMLIPGATVYEAEKGDINIVVWAIQRALNEQGYTLLIDGVFGDQTDWAVKEFQRKNELFVDGVFGQKSSDLLAKKLAGKQLGTPRGLIYSVVAGESGGLIGAVNWAVVGGVDCSYVQRRVYDDDYNNSEVIQRAFNAPYQMTLLKDRLIERYDVYVGRSNVPSVERAWRLAVLHHNWPYGADLLSITTESALSTYWKTPQQWVLNIGAKFDNGTSVRTPLEWAKFYSLGAPEYNHKGKMVKYVTNWSVNT